MFRTFIAFFVLTIFFCQTQMAQTVTNPVDSQTEKSVQTVNEFVETFSDDKNVGTHGKNKIEIKNFKKHISDKANKSGNTNIAEVKFYSLNENKEWILKQRFEFEKDDILGCDPQIKDFSNDGFKDVTYVSAVAARSANEVRTLFIYDRAKDELIHIKNSEEYPNLIYNRELDCLDSMMFHGTSTTVFVKIEGDMLKEFASVGNDGLTRTVYVIGKDGEEKILREDKISEDEIYARYKNYNPLKEYTSADFKQKNRKRARGKL